MDAILLVLANGELQRKRLERDRDLLLVLRRTDAFRSGSQRACSTRSGGRGLLEYDTAWSGSTGSGCGRRCDGQGAAGRARETGPNPH